MAETGLRRNLNIYLGFVFLAAIIGVSGYFIYRAVFQYELTYTQIVICDNCQHIFEKSFTEGQSSPFGCPNCKKQSAYLALICRDCGHIFPNRHPKSSETIQCPICYRSNVVPLLEVPKKPVNDK